MIINTSLKLTILLILILIILYLCYLLVKYIKYLVIMKKYPSPPGIPILGHLKEATSSPADIFNFLRKCAKSHSYYALWILNTVSVNVYEPDDIELLTATMKHSKKSRIYRVITTWLREGLLTSSGRKWHERRKILTPSFHFNILQQFLHTFVERGNKLVDELKMNLDKPYIDIDPYIIDCTLQAIIETAMGSSLKSSKLQEYRELIHQMGYLALYKMARPATLTWLAWLYPKHYEQYFLAKKLQKVTSKVIEERSKTFKPSEMPKEDEVFLRKRKNLGMLDVLLLAKSKGEIDDAGILEEVDTFTFEGHDTTAKNIIFTLMLLANHKEIQDRVAEEIFEIVGPTKRPTYDDLQNMKYLENCIKESLRLYPSVHFISRETTETVPFRDNVLPKGSMVFLHIYDLHRNPKYFPEPSKFDPDRFLPENCVDRHPFAYLPFSAGPRNCIGQKFAMMEVKTILLYVLREFEILPIDTPESITLVVDIILRATSPIKVKLQPRLRRT